jgi:hypothetical protein
LNIIISVLLGYYLTALDSKFFTSITFADVSKAFDRVWIGELLLKLERYGIKGDLLMWLKSYLTNRSMVKNVFKYNFFKYFTYTR